MPCVPPEAVGVPEEEELDTSPVGVPSPSIPAPPVGCGPPLLSTVLLAWMIAWRKGWTPNDTLAKIAIPASTTTGRSQLTLSIRPERALDERAPDGSAAPVRGSRRSRGQGTAASAGAVAGHAHDNRHAQCPRQVQCLARSRT
jgi:hypothetical protein